MPRHPAEGYISQIIFVLPFLHHPLRHHHFFHLLLQALRPSCAFRPSTHGPRSHQPSEERPAYRSLLQLWQARPHHQGLHDAAHADVLSRWGRSHYVLAVRDTAPPPTTSPNSTLI